MTSGGKQAREESVQFSLKELLKLEDERLDEQARATKAAEAAALRAKEEAAARKRSEEESARAREAEAKEGERRAELDTIARREAMERAVLEQSRLEVDVRARAEEREQERRHEIELARLRLEGKKGSLGALAGSTLLGGAVVMLVALGIHFGVTKPTEVRRIAELEGAVASAESRVREESQRTEQERWRADGLEKKNTALRVQLDELRQKASSPSAPPPTGGRFGGHPPPASQPPPAKPETICIPGDPLCPTITPARR
jgi:hypothetical protein